MASRHSVRPRQTLTGLTRLASTPLAGAVILGGVAAGFLIAQMGLLAQIVTDLAFRHHTLNSELFYIEILIGCVVLRALCQTGADTLGDYAGQKVTSAVRLDLLSHLFRIGPVGLVSHNSGHIATALSEGIEALHPYIARYTPRAAAMVVTPLLILAVVLKLDWWSCLILAMTGPLIPIFMALVGYSAQNIMDRKWTELLLLGASFLDMLQGLTTLRLFGRTRDGLTLVAHMARSHRRSTMAVMRVAFLTSAVLEFFASLAIALVAVVFGARLLNVTVAFQEAFFVLLLAPEFFMPLRNFSASYHARQNAVSAFGPISDLLALPPLRQKHPAITPAPSSPLKAIVLDHLRAGYGEDADILHDLSAHLQRDQLTLLTGASGSGKTTLMRLLLGLMPPRAGHCFAQREDGSTQPLTELRIGWVPQHPFLFAGSIAENLRLASPDASEADLHTVLADTALHDVIAALPQGLHSHLGERGAPLSAGQIRRLSPARALLGKPELLLFDEPTADLDPHNAAYVAETIIRAVAGRVGLVIAHRPELAQHAHKHLTLAHGRWTDTGEAA